MDSLRMPSVDFALFPMSCTEHDQLLGWEVTMLDVTMFQDASHTGREQRACSLPLLIGEVTELLEGPVLELVVKHRLKLWLPIAYAYLDDDDWIDALIEQVSRPKGSVQGVALIVRWEDLAPGLQRLRRNVERLREIGLHAVEATHAPLALAARHGSIGCDGSARRGQAGDARHGRSTSEVHSIGFGAAVSLESVVRQLS